MPHTLRDFDGAYEEAVQRININDLIQLLDLLSWDELGVRMFERAIVLVAISLRTRGVDVRRHDPDRPDRTSPASGATRENLSAGENLHSQPFLRWAAPWFWFEKMAQKPDGLFSMTLLHGEHEEELLVCYESDGHAKDESHEMRKVVMKMWQAVDAARWTRTGTRRRSDLSAYTVRANLQYTRQDNTLPDKVKRGLGALYRLMRGHVYAVMLIVDDWLASLPGTKQPDADPEDVLPRIKNMLFDHHILIGCFDLPSTRQLILPPTWLYEKCKPLHWEAKYGDPNYNCLLPVQNFIDYMTVGDNSDHKQDLNDTPLPLIARTGTNLRKPYNFADNVEVEWRAEAKVRSWGKMECHCVSLQRVNTDYVQQWLDMRELSKRRSNMKLLHGVWYVTDLRYVLQTMPFMLTDLFGSSWGNIHPQAEDTENEDASGQRRRMQRQVTEARLQTSAKTAAFTANALRDTPNGHFLYIIHNIIARMEAAVLALLKTNMGFHLQREDGTWHADKAQYVLRWKPNSLLTKTEKLAGDGILRAIQVVLRDNPHMLRQRHSQRTDFWEQYNKANGTLRAKCYVCLEDNLPKLDEHVERYLEQYQVPNAALFFRLIRCNSILALRELARQIDSKRMDQAVARHLATLDVCVQSEVNYIFDRIRENLDVYVDSSEVGASIGEETLGVPSKHRSDNDILMDLVSLVCPEQKNPAERFTLLGRALDAAGGRLNADLEVIAALLFHDVHDEPANP